jgi:hypothetical protein
MYVLTRSRDRRLLTLLYSFVIKELCADGKLISARRNTAPSVPTALFLSFEQFRPGEAEGLVASGQVRVLLISEHWLTRLMFQFYPVEIGQDSYRHYLNPHEKDPTWLGKHTYRKFLTEFLSHLYSALNIQLTVGHHFHYIPDIDWGPVSSQLGYPYVVFHRENLYPTQVIKKTVLTRIGPLGRFEGDRVVVHNQIAKDLFVKTGFFDEKTIDILGCIRMDQFLQQISERTSRKQPKKRKITFFAFSLALIFNKNLMFRLFSDTVVQFVDCARRNPDIDMIIKVKPNLYNNWRKNFDKALAKAELEPTTIPNLLITTDVSPHELIFSSDVICGFNSTTILEAGLAGKKVVIPYFDYLRAEEYHEQIFFNESLNLFDTPDTPEEFEKLLLTNPEESEIEEPILEGRRQLFSQYVSSLDGMAAQRHIQLLHELVGNTTVSENKPGHDIDELQIKSA